MISRYSALRAFKIRASSTGMTSFEKKMIMLFHCKIITIVKSMHALGLNRFPKV